MPNFVGKGDPSCINVPTCVRKANVGGNVPSIPITSVAQTLCVSSACCVRGASWWTAVVEEMKEWIFRRKRRSPVSAAFDVLRERKETGSMRRGEQVSRGLVLWLSKINHERKCESCTDKCITRKERVKKA